MQFPVPISKAPLFSTSSVRVCVCVMHFHQVQQVIYFRCVFCQTSVEEIDFNCHEAHDDLSSTLEEAGKKQREGSSMLEMAFLRTHFRFLFISGEEGRVERIHPPLGLTGKTKIPMYSARAQDGPQDMERK